MAFQKSFLGRLGAQSAVCPALDFGSSRDLRIMRWSPSLGSVFSAQQGAGLRLSVPPPLPPTRSLSKKIILKVEKLPYSHTCQRQTRPVERFLLRPSSRRLYPSRGKDGRVRGSLVRPERVFPRLESALSQPFLPLRVRPPGCVAPTAEGLGRSSRTHGHREDPVSGLYSLCS